MQRTQSELACGKQAGIQRIERIGRIERLKGSEAIERVEWINGAKGLFV
jgi:hypothetical protein